MPSVAPRSFDVVQPSNTAAAGAAGMPSLESEAEELSRPSTAVVPLQPAATSVMPEAETLEAEDDKEEGSASGSAHGDVEPPSQTPRSGRFSPFRYNRVAFTVTGAALLAILLIGAGSFFALNKHGAKPHATDAQKIHNYSVGNLPISGANLSDQQLQIGQAANLSINGQLKANNTLVLSPTGTPSNPVPGEIYYNQVNNVIYYYNGTQFISLSPQAVTSLGGASGAITLGDSLSIVNNQLSISNSILQQISNAGSSTTPHVTSLQGQTGAVTLGSGPGISINGTTINNSGVLSIAGTANQINVSGTTGDISLSLPQDIAVASSPTFGGLTVSGTLSVATLQQTAPGNNLNITAGNDAISFTAGGRTFIFPTSGPTSQTICTTGISCASGGGQAVLLQPGSAQTDTGSGPSIFYNNTGGGTLVELQSGGLDHFVVSNNGSVSAGAYNGQTISAAANFTGSVTIQGSGLTLGTTGSNTGTIVFRGSSPGSGTLTLQGPAAPDTGNFTLSVPVISGNDTLCTVNLGNCAGSGGGITGSGTTNTIALFSGTHAVGNSILTQSGSTVTAAGTLAATALQGDGSGITNLNGTNIATGTVANARLVNGGALTVTAGNGLTGGGSVALGSSTSLAVAYGSIANTAVQGNTSLTCASGTGNLSGGGTAITLGTGGTCGSISITNSPTFTGTLAVQGAGGITVGVAGASGTVGVIKLANGSNANLTTLQSDVAGQNQTISIPDAGAATDEVCLVNLGNCAGSGGGITGSGTTNTIALFSGTHAVGNSILTQSGSTVTAAGTLAATALQGDGSGITNLNGTNIATGTVANARLVNGGALTVTAGNGLTGGGSVALGSSTSLAVAYGSIANTAVQGNTSLTCASGTGNLSGGGTAITLGTGGTCGSISITNSPTFTGTLAVQGAGGITVGVAGASGTVGVIKLANGSNANLTTLQSDVAGQNQTISIPDAGAATDEVCLVNLGNCAGSGGGITGSGTTNTIALFSGTHAVGNSILTQSGSTVTAAGTLAATALQGDGSGITNLNGTNIATGTVANARLVNGGALTVTAGNGLTGGGSVALGSSTSLAVAYGSIANTAVQGNTSLTCASGTGNLSGGGTAITLGTGGTCGSISITNSPTFTGTLAVQGAGGITVGVAGASGTVGVIKLANGSNANLTTLQSDVAGQNQTISIPDAGAATDEVCLVNLGNCAGSGGGITGSGTTNTIALFSGTHAVGNSILTQSGSTVTAAGTVVIQGANSLELGTASGNTGAVTFRNSANANKLTLQAGATTGNLTLTLPTADGGNGDCLITDGFGALSFQSCTGGAGGGVTSLDTLTGVLTLNNSSGSGSAITIDDASTSQKGIAQFNSTNFSTGGGVVNTIQDIAATASPVFVSPNATTGINTGAGAGTQRITAAGNLVNIGTITTSGAINGQTISAAANFTGTLAVQGAGGITVGVAGASGTVGVIKLANGSNANLTTLQSDVAGQNQTISIPDAGAATDEVCLVNLGNCAGSGGGITGSGTTNTIALFSGTHAVGNSILTQSGSTVTAAGTLAATALQGDGSGITNLNGTNIATGTVANARLVNGGALTVTAGNGLTGGGSVALGSSTSLAVAYGSIANTAVQGNTSLTCASGTGNLSGGGTAITLGTGGTCGSISITNSPTFTGTLAVQGAGGITVGVAGASGTVGVIKLANGSNANLTTLQSDVAGQNQTISIPDAGAATDEVCLVNLGNCAGSGGGITGSGTTNTIALFSGTHAVGNSILTQSGTTVSVGGSLTATGTLQGNIVNATGGGAAIQLNGTDINTAGTLGNVAYLNASNTFTGTTNTFSAAGGKTTLALSSTGTNTGITLGGDTTLYRSAANNLKTDGALTVGQDLLIQGNQLEFAAGPTLVASSGTSPPSLQLQGGFFFVVGSSSTTEAYCSAINSDPNCRLQIRTDGLLQWGSGTSVADTTLYRSAAGVLKTDGTLNVVSGYQINGTAGASTTCSGGQFLQNQVVVGGITTAGTCAAAGGGITTVGTIDSQTKSADGAVISGSSIYLQTADASNPGLVSTGSQTFAGAKTFTGAATFQSTGTTALQIQNAGGTSNLFIADTTDSVVGIGMQPTAAGAMLQVATTITAQSGTTAEIVIGSNCSAWDAAICFSNGIDLYNYNNGASLKTDGEFDAGQLFAVGGLSFSTFHAIPFTTPTGATVDTKINIPLFNPGSFSQLIALGLPAGSDPTSRAISVFDARTSTDNQPAIAVLSPDESNIFGLSWEGLSTTGYLKIAGGGALGFKSGSNVLLNLSSVGDATLTGDLQVQGGDLTTNQTTFNLLNTTATTLNIGGAVDSGGINLAGGSGSTGCTIDGSNGNLTCSGSISSTATSGTQGWWSRSGTTLQPANSGDAITTSGNISTTGNGTITAAGLLTGSAGATISGAVTSINGSSNFATNINTGSSTGAVSIGNSAAGAVAIQSGSTIALTSGTTLGLTSTGSNAININPGGGSNTGVLIKPGTNSTAAFQIQSTSNASLFTADTSGMNIVMQGGYSGETSAWASTTSTGLPAREGNSSVIANGYIYMIAGYNSGAQADVYYAKLNANGTTGSWTATTSIPGGRDGSAAVFSNGYIYVLGGSNSQSTYYAKPNADGTITSWSTGSNLPSATRNDVGVAANNGYIYAVGGSQSATSSTTVSYAKQNPDGSMGSFTTTSLLPAGLFGNRAVIANGYIYTFGGFSGATTQSTVYKAQINADGTLGSWSSSGLASLPNPRFEYAAALANGYIYIMGGIQQSNVNGNPTNSIYYAHINADGTISSWNTSSHSLPDSLRWVSGGTANGYLYTVNGDDGSPTSAVYYSSVSRVQIAGSLDLVGINGGDLADPGSGGTLTAGDTTIAGTLQVSGQANFSQGVGISGTLGVGSDINTNGVYRANGVAGISLACGTSHVVTSVTVTGGIITGGNCSTGTLADLAENYNSTESLSPGEVVSVDSDNSQYVQRATVPHDDSLIGVVSTDPAQVLNPDDPGYPIALGGRVPVKVNLEGGAIEPGDKLTSSSTPGEAMKATGPGMIIGTAMTGYDGSQSSAEVIVFVGTGYYDGPQPISYVQNGGNAALSDLTVGGMSDLADLNVSGTATINNLNVTGSATIGTLTVTGNAHIAGDLTIDGHIITAGGQPTAQGQGAVGAGAVVAVDGTDTTGTITITTGSDPTSGDLAKILFSKTYGQAPHIVLSPSNNNAAGLRFYKGATTSTDFMFNALDTPQANTTYTFDYFIAQ